MSSKPKVSGLIEEEYWRTFHVVRGDVEAAIKSNSAYWKINNLARDDDSILARYNSHAHFWTLNAYALQSTFFISFGRIFDERRECFSVQKLVAATINSPSFFTKEALRLRKRKVANIVGADPQWLIDYVNAAWQPTQAELLILRNALLPHHQRFKAIYQPIRHTYFAHRGTSSDNAIHDLFQKTLVTEVSDILRFLHTLLWSIDQMGLNARPIDLTDFDDYNNWVRKLDREIEEFVNSLTKED